MNETDEYILKAIRTAVWSGFYDVDDVEEIVDDILEDDADEEMLRATITLEFEKKAQAELTWPAVTDCDRLNDAFAAAERADFVALQNAGYTMSDALSDVDEAAAERTPRPRFYCFFHGQDLERAVNGEGLMIAFGSFSDTLGDKKKAGQRISAHLQDAGLTVSWSGDAEERLHLPKLDWKRRRG